MDTKIVEITADNIGEHPQAVCFINPRHKFYALKVDWLKKQFKNGLKIKLLYIENEKRPIGFIEYVPGEHCWRAVTAKNYLFIHCIWINGKKYQRQAWGKLLLNEAEKEAKDLVGVAVMTSDGSFMANKEIFRKNGYSIIAESGKDQLLVKKTGDGPLPTINYWESELKKYQGIYFIYSRQCPWVARFIIEVKPFLITLGLKPTIIELETAKQAQKAPSFYSVFNFIYNGRLLADRYISTTRFLNIVKKEIRV